MINTPHKTRLIYIMEQEKQTKIKLIGAILDHQRDNKAIDLNTEFNRLYDLNLMQLNTIIEELICDTLCSINSRLERLAKKGKI